MSEKTTTGEIYITLLPPWSELVLIGMSSKNAKQRIKDQTGYFSRWDCCPEGYADYKIFAVTNALQTERDLKDLLEKHSLPRSSEMFCPSHGKTQLDIYNAAIDFVKQFEVTRRIVFSANILAEKCGFSKGRGRCGSTTALLSEFVIQALRAEIPFTFKKLKFMSDNEKSAIRANNNSHQTMIANNRQRMLTVMADFFNEIKPGDILYYRKNSVSYVRYVIRKNYLTPLD